MLVEVKGSSRFDISTFKFIETCKLVNPNKQLILQEAPENFSFIYNCRSFDEIVDLNKELKKTRFERFNYFIKIDFKFFIYRINKKIFTTFFINEKI
jgi:hypothetical protein